MAAAARPHIVVITGVTGSGKSTLAATLARTLGWDLLEGGDLRLEIGPPPAEMTAAAPAALRAHS